MGIGVVDPILPVIAKQIGASHWQVELLFTAYIFTMAVMMIPASLLAGKFGDKNMITFGLAVVTIFALLCGFSNTVAELSIFRAGWGFGNAMFFATAMTLLIALSEEISSAVGLYEAAIGLGMAGGPLLGGLIGEASWRYPFFATGGLIFLALLLVIILVKEPVQQHTRKAPGIKQIGSLLKYLPFTQGAFAGMLYYYGFFTVLAYSPLIIDLSAIHLGFIFFGWGISLAYGSAILSHQLERKWQPVTLIKVGLTAFIILLALLLFVKIVWLEIVLIVLSGLASGLNNALFTSYVMDISPYARNVTSGVYNFVRWFGAALAPLLSGVVGEAFTPHVPFGVAAAVVLAGLVLMLMPVKKQTQKQESSEYALLTRKMVRSPK
ncbi:MFS transporter [Halobacillus salinarum]|uniref:MFS transporter n=2 Tax=Halobacillus salinarum TaxID=2932257 RepID=A0ABY4EPL8_9BACI|nr:MFS transporter [Halobacillus salinarum]